MVKLFCALVGVKGNAFSVTIDASESVDDLKKAIKLEKENDLKAVDADKLELFLAKKDDDTWLNSSGVGTVKVDENGHPVGFDHMNVVGFPLNAVGLSEEDVRYEFTKEDMKAKRFPIHVLVVVPTDEVAAPMQWGGEPARKRARSSTDIKDEDIKTIGYSLEGDNMIDRLNIVAWKVGGIALDICRVESDFPNWFYVRKETLDIIKIFEDHMALNLNTVFVGTPGVGKSMLVVLFAFYMALRQNKRVVLFRKQKGKGYSILYLDAKNKKYWRRNKAQIRDLDELADEDFELCLDGLVHADIENHFGTLGGFRLLATSVQYPLKNDDGPVLRRCLVPFWFKLDLNAIGVQFQWTEHEIKNKYFLSGGNLRDFLSTKGVVIESIGQAVQVADSSVAKLLNTQYGLGSVRQIDRLRMVGIGAEELIYRDVTKYTMSKAWVCVITSEYALRQLGKIVEASYYEVLWTKGRMLGDDGLMGIAFENYVHTLARDGKKIELSMRAYDRVKQSNHIYAALEFEAKSCRSGGIDAAECDAVMKQLSSSSDDYWYPSSRSLKTIDCVAKLNVDGQGCEVGLIQITKSDHHIINSVVLDKYATFFSNSSRYIALVPDEKTCKNFRLDPVSPPTEVPLYVAYITTWNL